ncbi:LexA family protein [Entomobacter blattae]|uniref:LexA repressor n=1 Tax=Entomobacter blattae TaxID=2762277 RepID=A0A7H1NRK1_9PROT|nr:translesion error-prone DNA polymerase V autoproteolytic subunit [Entomobacter blattae]QNT78411.1 LexA repressor [Entomobacter blattae]
MITIIKKIDEPLLSKKLPFCTSAVRAGFPSPADDYRNPDLDLYEHLITHPSATFFLRVEGESMQGFGIFHDDLLIVDRALDAQSGDIVIAAVDGELTCKQLVKKMSFIISRPGTLIIHSFRYKIMILPCGVW